MPGSMTPQKLDDWPLDEQGRQDIPGMAQYLNDRIVAFSQDQVRNCQKIDQGILDNILQRLMTAGTAGLTDDDIPHIVNVLALCIATDEISACRGCLNEIAKFIGKVQSDLN